MPIRPIDSIGTVTSRIWSLATCVTIVILLQLFVHDEVGTWNLADKELVGVRDLKLAERLKLWLVGLIEFVETFLLYIVQSAIG